MNETEWKPDLPTPMKAELHVFLYLTALFQNEEEDEEKDGNESTGKLGTQLQRRERPSGGCSGLPDTFQTSQLLFYERFKAYQDYMLGNRIRVRDRGGDGAEP